MFSLKEVINRQKLSIKREHQNGKKFAILGDVKKSQREIRTPFINWRNDENNDSNA